MRCWDVSSGDRRPPPPSALNVFSGGAVASVSGISFSLETHQGGRASQRGFAPPRPVVAGSPRNSVGKVGKRSPAVVTSPFVPQLPSAASWARQGALKKQTGAPFSGTGSAAALLRHEQRGALRRPPQGGWRESLPTALLVELLAGKGASLTPPPPLTHPLRAYPTVPSVEAVVSLLPGTLASWSD